MLATSTTVIAWIIALALLIGFIVFAAMNARAARPELGSEIELAPNRKPYYTDEVLEGPRLERFQLIAVALLVVCALGLPLYWMFEPARQAGAQVKKVHEFEGWGAELFETTANGGFNCAGCHGGMQAQGSTAPFTVTNAVTGEITSVNWNAPALNTIFYRFSDDEVKYILQYGRTFSPMSAWGTVGGGPMNDQQLDTLISYIKSIQIPREGCAPTETDPKTCASGVLPESKQKEIADAADAAAQALVDAGKYATKEDALGEALFNLDLDRGAYSCARCHTRGWSYGEPGASGQGAYGWNLTGGSTIAAFPNEADMVTFLSTGSEQGKKYGTQGMGTGRMPGFGKVLTEEQLKAIADYVRNKL